MRGAGCTAVQRYKRVNRKARAERYRPVLPCESAEDFCKDLQGAPGGVPCPVAGAGGRMRRMRARGAAVRGRPAGAEQGPFSGPTCPA